MGSGLMATSSWAKSWFQSWGASWGAVDEEEQPKKQGGGKFVFRPSQPILFDDPVQIRQREEDALLMLGVL